MTADKRNTTVVIALIVSMTLGIAVLLPLERQRPNWGAAPQLAALGEARITDIQIDYVGTAAQAEQLRTDETLCIVYADRDPALTPGRAHARLVVVGSGADGLSDRQKNLLLGSLAGLNGYGRRPGELAEMRLGATLDGVQPANLPAEADALVKLLVERQLIRAPNRSAGLAGKPGPA